MAKSKKKMKSKGKQAAKVSVENVREDVIADALNSDAISVVYSSVNQSVFMKLCRLCESKDGPFLNIFDAEKITAKKIEELMPFGIAENDDLPHKICFRCSAKVEELYEFLQKCIKTQESLRNALGKSGPLAVKTKTRAIWEEKLNKSNISNDDICNALIKKAMEGIKDIPLQELPKEDLNPAPISSFKHSTKINIEPSTQKKQLKPVILADDSDTEKEPEVEPERISPPVLRKTRSNRVDMYKEQVDKPIKDTTKKQETNVPAVKQSNNSINTLSLDYEAPVDKVKHKEEEKPFNIMDHVSIIKVADVGILFQCKLCNRNFVEKKVVESHNCAKNGVPKLDFTKKISTPEPPKVPTVKYIKIDANMKKALTEKNTKLENSRLESSKVITNEERNKEAPIKPVPEVRTKPKIGPASKVKRHDSNTEQSSQKTNTQESSKSKVEPSVFFPNLPSLNGRYKLVPGPNNTYTLVEEKNANNTEASNAPEPDLKASKKRKLDEVKIAEPKFKLKEPVHTKSKPYPVGLFQTVAHHSRLYEPPPPEPQTYTTPAMKKQSYTVVQTGHPNKLVISSKPQPLEEETPRRKQKKNKGELKDTSSQKEPFTVTLEDVAPPKDPGFFTFINVDPLLQPSYVLPTDSIIQESQISTSTPAVSKVTESKDKDKYSCNMCGETFSREKKLLTHIQSHYAKMDEEDQLREERGARKKTRRQ